MKKVISIFVAIFAIVIVVAGCNSDDTINYQETSNDFYVSLNQLRQKEEVIIGNATRSSSELTEEELQAIVEQIDNQTVQFIQDNIEILAQYAIHPLSEDSIDLVLMDEETLDTYLRSNFPDEFVEAFYNACEVDETRSTDAVSASTTSTSLNPMQALVVTNAQVFTEVTQLMDTSAGSKKPITEAKKKECLGIFNVAKNWCNIKAGGATLLGYAAIAAAAYFSGGTSLTASAAAGSAVDTAAFAYYVGCVNSAKSDYNKCIN